MGKDMATYSNAPKFLENPEMYGDMGELVSNVLHGIYNLDLSPRKKLLPTALGAFKKSKIGALRLAKIAFEAVRSL